jgi:hypothetical protein
MIVRCKSCNVELESHSTQTKCCGCPNMTTVIENKITAIDLTKVIMVKSPEDNQKLLYFLHKILLFRKQDDNVRFVV